MLGASHTEWSGTVVFVVLGVSSSPSDTNLKGMSLMWYPKSLHSFYIWIYSDFEADASY